MTTNSSAGTCHVRVEYFSGGETFAVDTFHVDEPASGEIEAVVAAIAEASPYFNDRVPELSYAITIVPIDPDDPEPPPAGARAKPVCAHCGSDQLVRDAAVRWDVDAQDWMVSGIYDCTTCDICGAESDNLAKWVHAGHVTPLDRFMRDLAAALGKADFVRNYEFAQFCLDYYQQTALAEAVVAWHARGTPAP